METMTATATDKRIDELRSEMHQRFELVDHRFDRIEGDVREIRTEVRDLRAEVKAGDEALRNEIESRR